MMQYASSILNKKVRIPKIYCAYLKKESVFIMMEKMRGNTLNETWEGLSIKEQTSVISQLHDAVQCMRQNRQVIFSGLDSSPLAHLILSKRSIYKQDRIFFGPFHSVKEFHDHLIKSHSAKEICKKSPDRYNKWLNSFENHDWMEKNAVFSHGDLSPHNIMIDKEARVSIIDWETAGWWPSYIEYYMANRYDYGWFHLGIVISDWIPFEREENVIFANLFYYYFIV